MTQPINPPPAPLDYATPERPVFSQRGGLNTFGIITILLGVISACLTAATPMALVISRAANTPVAPDLPTVLLMALFYLAATVALIWLGIGSCQCKRWVRPIVLVVAYPCLILGVILFVGFLLNLPAQVHAMSTTPPICPIAVMSMIVAGSLFFLVFAVGLPSLYIWFYRRPKVEMTLNFYDPNRNWTDRCPLPVLGLSVWLGMSALSFLMLLPHPCVPFFGIYVAGLPAVAMILITSILWALAAVAAYRLRPIAWWFALLFTVLAPLSAMISFGRLGIMEYYRASGLSAQQLQFMQEISESRLLPQLIMPIVLGALAVGYLLYVRRFFSWLR
jgi:hypothetical protein